MYSAPKDGGISNTYYLQRVENYIVYTNISDNKFANNDTGENRA